MTLTKTISYTFVGAVISLALFVALPTFAATTGGWTSVSLSGSEEVPSVNTTTTGQFRFNVADNENSMEYELNVNDGENITAAHIHCAPDEQNGPVVVELYSNTATSGIDVDGELLGGTLNDNDILASGVDCSTDVTDIDSLEDALENNILYVNVHSVEYPNGLIRGQLSDEDDGDDDNDGGDDDTDNGNGHVDQDIERLISRLQSFIERLHDLLDRYESTSERRSR